MSFGPWPLSVLAGVLVWLGFAGVGLWPLALVAFVPLFAALERDAHASGLRVWLLGLVCGSVAWAGACDWVVGTLRTFSGLPLTACLGIALLFWIYHGGLFACFGWLWWRLRRRGASAALAAATAFAVSEHVYPRIFPSHYAASLHGVPIALQIMELGGPLLLSALIASISGAFYELAVHWPSPGARRAGGVVGLCVLAALGYGVLRTAQVDASLPAAPRIRVGIVQPNMRGLAKWEKPAEGLRRLVEGTRRLEQSVQPDLILWPENAHAAGLPYDLERLPQALRDAVQTPIVFGAAVRRRIDGELRGRNRVLLSDEHGGIRGTYDKVELLAFGEYMPLASRIPWLRSLSPLRGRVEPGDRLDPLPYREWRISALVCFEDILPGFVRRVMRAGAPHLLVNLTNDAWFGDSQEPWIHLALAKLRAVEQRRYLVRATNTGVSTVIDPLGRVVVQSGSFTQETLHAEVAMLEGRTVYQALGDWPGWLSLGGVLWLAFARRDLRAAARAGTRSLPT